MCASVLVCTHSLRSGTQLLTVSGKVQLIMSGGGSITANCSPATQKMYFMITKQCRKEGRSEL